MMRARGVRVFSITDHDTMRAYGKFVADSRPSSRASRSTRLEDNEVHVLGYGCPWATIRRWRGAGREPRVPAHADRPHGRRARCGRLSGHGRRRGAESDGGDALGRPHVAKALIRKGLVRDVEAAFRELLTRGKPGYMPSNYITPADAIDVIRKSGGVPVLAHPGRLKTTPSSTG